jgi:hypothetical protein
MRCAADTALPVGGLPRVRECRVAFTTYNVTRYDKFNNEVPWGVPRAFFGGVKIRFN